MISAISAQAACNAEPVQAGGAVPERPAAGDWTNALPGLSGPCRHDGAGAGVGRHGGCDARHRRMPASPSTALPRNLTAAYELIARAGLTHGRPPFGIDQRHGRQPRSRGAARRRRTSRRSARCCISSKDIDVAQPRVLLVAPLSGHFATLLRGTVRTMLPEHDVYITDWHNARDVAAAARPLRLRRLCRPPDPLPRGDRARRACRRGLPALRRGAGGRRGDGAEPTTRRSRAA